MPATRLRRPPGALALGLAVLVGVAGTIGMKVSADQRTGAVTRDEQVVKALETPANDAPAENYLLVGSDSRQGISANDPNAGAIGNADEVVGGRSDTIMVLRRERNGGAYLLSIPRDMWVTIAGTGKKGKINSAYNEGSARLVETVSTAFGIPINHYVEIDFAGFQHLVDQIGGVTICSYYQAQDLHSGLHMQPGCTNLNGSQALAYARSRYFQEWRNGGWHEDGTADIGRIKRQQAFIKTAVTKLLDEMQSQPFKIGELISAATGAVTIDKGLDPVKAGSALRQAAENGLVTYSLPFKPADHGGQSALDLDAAAAKPILDFFKGAGAAPPPPPTTPTSTPPTSVAGG